MIVNRRSFRSASLPRRFLAGDRCRPRAQSYPSRPIRLIVGFAAGGPTDVLARIIGGKMSEILGQQVVIENRTGASGNIATQFVVRAPNDGYTILMGANSNAVNESLFKNLGFNFAKDLIPGRAARRSADRAGGASVARGEIGQGPDQPRQGKARRDHVRDRRQGYDDTPRGRALQSDGRRQADRGAVQRQRRDHQGSAVRPDQGDVLARCRR